MAGTQWKAVHFIVSGRVQGVGFRHAARRKAGQLGLSGWVANRPNGDVEAVAHGDAARLGRFEAWLRVGPQYARVDRVEATPAAAGPVGDFHIRL
ncbi:MAG: acylphosphatase [Gammaproteobacteria bacterium]|nr:acylphosphatase [Gammaproteobacteria bacterium]MDD9873911.1 acylphosphatase [Gammaproteobacteria bacterium]